MKTNNNIKDISDREKFNEIINFKKPIQKLRWYTLGFWGETKQLWQQENNLTLYVDLNSYFGLTYPVWLPFNTGGSGIPYTIPFDEKIIKENENEKIRIGIDGITRKEIKNGVSMPQWLSFPVNSEDDWEDVKKRIDPDRHNYGENYKDNIKKYIDNNEVNAIFINGIYAFHRNLLGEENLAYAYFDMPEVIKDMSLHWLKFYSTILRQIIHDTRVDFVLFHEDMAYKTAPLIGPDIFNEFMTPFYKEMTQFLINLNVKNLMVDCDGNLEILLPLFNEIGINMMVPFEQAAGNDIIEIRNRYPELIMWGGIDKRVLNMTKEDIKKEVYEKIPYMLDKGGFIPCIDHSTQPCKMENFVYLLELLDNI